MREVGLRVLDVQAQRPKLTPQYLRTSWGMDTHKPITNMLCRRQRQEDSCPARFSKKCYLEGIR